MYSESMTERTIMASAFKEQCLAVLDQVALDHISVVVTKRGRPVARLVPIDGGPSSRPTMGSVRLIAEDDEAYFSTGERWEAES
jgi:prevent-host-death family protein